MFYELPKCKTHNMMAQEVSALVVGVVCLAMACAESRRAGIVQCCAGVSWSWSFGTCSFTTYDNYKQPL